LLKLNSLVKMNLVMEEAKFSLNEKWENILVLMVFVEKQMLS